MTMARRARIGLMIIMPTFAVGDEADHDVVAARPNLIYAR
jgi:hypothetical protein